MSKWYSVEVIAAKTILVEVKDDEDNTDAESVALDEAFSFCDFVEVKSSSLIENERQLESAKRHADEVFDLGD